LRIQTKKTLVSALRQNVVSPFIEVNQWV
jgi:hypothetical protein